MSTPVTNFGKVTVSTGYDAAAVTIVLTTGHGSRLPSTFPYPMTWWDATTYSDPSDDPQREIVLVTNRTGDTLTVTRGQESTSASTKNTASKTYKMFSGVTAKMWEQVQELALSETFRGLRLQTHPDSDKAAAQVRLVHADAIVMDDGEEIAEWNDLDASLAVSGIGGLDTGSEQASTWYQIIAARNPLTDARGIYFHRAKNYFLDESVTAGEDATQGCRSNVDNSTVKVSMGFKEDTAGPIEFKDVKLIKVGTPTGNFWFTIEVNSGGVPSNTPLATSRKYDVSRMPTTALFVRVPFDAPYAASVATQYHLVLQGDWAVSGTNYLGWRMDGSAGAYANGNKALFDSDTSTWTADTDDVMMFKSYVTENDTALTKPAGYTQSAVIGWAYNNASSNLKHFWANDRRISCGQDPEWLIGAFTAGVRLVDLFAFVPPIPIGLIVGVDQVTSDSSNAIGQLDSTDISAGTAKVGIVGAKIFIGAGGPLPVLELGPYQGMMNDVNASTGNYYVSSMLW